MINRRQTRRTHENWAALIAEHANSGQTVTKFCKEREINPKYFSSKKIKLKNIAKEQHAPSKFVSVAPPETAILNNTSEILIEYGQAKISLPTSTPFPWIATLLKELR